MRLNSKLSVVILASVAVFLAGCNVNPSSPDTMVDEPPPEPDVPTNSYCEVVAEWDEAWAAFEEEVVALMNGHRAQGADCGTAGVFEATQPLTMDPALRCAARVHSRDMNLRDFFGHTNPDGDGPADRMRAAGYMPLFWAENIALGNASPQAVVDGWMNSDGHCANIMRSSLTDVGIGFYEGNYWTAAFGDD